MTLRDQFLEVQKCMRRAIIGQETVIERLMIKTLARGFEGQCPCCRRKFTEANS